MNLTTSEDEYESAGYGIGDLGTLGEAIGIEAGTVVEDQGLFSTVFGGILGGGGGGSSASSGSGAPPLPPGQGALHSTSAQILGDAAMLRQLGFDAPDDPTGLSEPFRAAVAAYQRKVSPRAGKVDGLTGPTTRTALQQDVGRAPAPSAPLALPSSPSKPTIPGTAPASITQAGSTPNLLLIGAGVLALVVVGALVLGGKKKKGSESK